MRQEKPGGIAEQALEQVREPEISRVKIGVGRQQKDATQYTGEGLVAAANLQGGIVTRATSLSTDRLMVGQGFNTATGIECGLAIAFNPDNEGDLVSVGRKSGQDVNYKLEQIETIQQLRATLGISAAASFGWGIFHGDASYNFFSSRSESRYSSYLLVEATVRNPALILKKRALSESAKSLLRQREPNDPKVLGFFGNCFVCGYRSGGQILAIVEINTDSQEEQESISASLSASFGTFGGADGKLEETLNVVMRHSSTRVHIIRAGGNPGIPTLGTLIQTIQDFADQVKKDDGFASTVEVLLAGYNTVDDLPDNFPSMLALDQQEENLAVLSGLLDRAISLRSDFIAVEKDRSAFEDISEENLRLLRNTTELTIAELSKSSEAVRDSVEGAGLPEEVTFADPPQRKPPTRHNLILKSQYIGGQTTLRVAGAETTPTVGNGFQVVKCEARINEINLTESMLNVTRAKDEGAYFEIHFGVYAKDPNIDVTVEMADGPGGTITITAPDAGFGEIVFEKSGTKSLRVA